MHALFVILLVLCFLIIYSALRSLFYALYKCAFIIINIIIIFILNLTLLRLNVCFSFAPGVLLSAQMKHVFMKIKLDDDS